MLDVIAKLYRAGRITPTRAYSEWAALDSDIRRYLDLGLRFAETGFDKLWQDILHRPGNPDEEVIDIADREIGIYPQTFEWMYLAGTLRDAVSVFELFAEKAIHELGEAALRIPARLPDDAAPWGNLSRTYEDVLGIDLMGDGVKDVRDRRHWLTHGRGEFRTEAQRSAYDTFKFGFPDDVLHLGRIDIERDMDTLAAKAEEIDLAIADYGWGSATLTSEQRQALADRLAALAKT